MSLIERIVNAVRMRGGPATGAIAGPQSGSLRSYPADGLTPQRLLSIARDADDGDLQEQLELYEQMEEKDAHLYSVAQTRRLAVTGLPWRIVPASAVDPRRHADRRAAQEAADACNRTLERIGRFDELLEFLALGIGRNVAAAELIWEAGPAGPELRDIIAVAFERLRTDAAGRLRIRTADEPRDGIEPGADKFIVHRPHGPGHAGRGGLLRVTALAFLAKHYAVKDWLIYMEVFGMPVRIARYAPSATPEEKRELLAMVQRLGTDAAGIFSKSVDLEIKQTRVPGDVAPYESICHFFNREISKAWLGQTLTTDTAKALSTARGAADVQDRVRRDIRDYDLRQEALTLRRDLLEPITRLTLGPDAPTPYFRRVAEPAVDPESLSRVLDAAVNRLGARVPPAWAHEALGIPEAGAAEAALPGRAAE